MGKIPQKYYDGYVDHRVNDVEVIWAKVYTPDTEFGKNQWEVQLVLNEEQATFFDDLGFNVRDKDGKKLLTCKKKASPGHDGTPAKPPRIVGRDGKPFTQEIGNGSRCNINMSARGWKVGMGCYLNSLQVVDHVEYNGGSGFSAIDEEDSEFS